METLGKYDSGFRTKEMGLWNDLKKYSHKWLPQSALTLIQTKNTWRKCLLCRGDKWNIMKLQSGLMIKKPCARCNGAGVVHE